MSADDKSVPDARPLPGVDTTGAQDPYRAHLAEQAAADSTFARGPALLDWKARWDVLGSTAKLRVKQAALAGAIGVLGYGLYAASSSSNKPESAAPAASKLDMGAGLRGDSLEVKLRGDFEKILGGQQLLGDRVTAIEEGKLPQHGAGTDAGATGADMGGDGGALPPALPGSAPAYPPSASGAGGGDAGLPAPPSIPAPPAAPPAPPIEKVVGSIGAATSPVLPKDASGTGADSKKKNRTIYLPPGFMKARLLTGVDALASRDATSNPEPVIARVQAPAVLPNDVKANLSGCFVIGNATGSLAKERVEVQLVSLSCVDFDEHSVVDQPVKGFFVDADGKKGLSGKVVTRAGAALARSFIAGTISGISQSVENTFGQTSTSALGSVRTLNAGDAAKTGIAGGLSKSSDKLTDFYLDLARQAGPVVEVGAAKEVVVVIQEGVTLEIKPSAGSKF
ncbi:IncF plasmid conjugative transfer pilus assembly protein TraB [Sphingobium indicum BiD32]|uniref:IncF plasmid conjugative transfer pilus assembly protein TraB n=1 Tax=Sphingobium indicum BiD32 TaxID=1301087 RepID=N1MLQ5_9SPHN|nr:TraB/VirB10 family protein [Sphingobium indicum]CCW16547.1 IncF plasmid conjugative transfer pilus assembly protein TraB [Sphingobium indicum BiD32]